MFLGKVVGKVVSTQKSEKLIGNKLLIVKKIDEKENLIGDHFVAVDTVGAGANDTVIVVTGSGSRNSSDSQNDIPIDASIVGIVDSIEWDER
ncbi:MULTISPECIES: EutN/CcmL family microcompartment protein [Clostridium]|uniref:Carbon dioxide concentrating mechanism protein CcmL n=4 Tax=Clostridium TaxID=1485 RepID=D8GNT4_CLOLD|nr:MULTISPECIES: EutN/CcmL family microcompartment protein [Clostridium]ADK13780.1 predicted microcompartment shellprotein [Clostridium ljungdahlii DSM 13528]OAA85028.1 Carbon dioxide concentrating mechanism protein CcmL [Clostridium ljungdahlii DSM 13528]OAA91514.1 Carbon dioxide concentrating mechanism protein CcmL [Clostridium coskatii]OBR90956.1 carbon dioxide concentrating mechanism protein CcmL [Clostridium coskatii]OBR93758.1 carbon dioxide concentrating mechanism protein CcmL [Clostrid